MPKVVLVILLPEPSGRVYGYVCLYICCRTALLHHNKAALSENSSAFGSPMSNNEFASVFCVVVYRRREVTGAENVTGDAQQLPTFYQLVSKQMSINLAEPSSRSFCKLGFRTLK